MIRKAFTLFELVIVIVVVGILLFVGVNSIPDNSLYEDANLYLLTLKKFKSKSMFSRNAIAGDGNISGAWRVDDGLKSEYCHILNKDLTENNVTRARKVRERIKMQITQGGIVLNNPKICFDDMGRVYRDDFNESNIMKEAISIHFSDGDRNLSPIKIHPYSGYINFEYRQ